MESQHCRTEIITVVLPGRDADTGGLQAGVRCVSASTTAARREATHSIQAEKQAYVALSRARISPRAANTQEKVATHTPGVLLCLETQTKTVKMELPVLTFGI